MGFRANNQFVRAGTPLHPGAKCERLVDRDASIVLVKSFKLARPFYLEEHHTAFLGKLSSPFEESVHGATV